MADLKKILNNTKLIFILAILLVVACDDELAEINENCPLLAIDSLVADKTEVIIWEEVFITAYTQGENLRFAWSTNHGSMAGVDSSTVKYWGCPSCDGINTVLCQVSNEHGTVQDTIVITVHPN